MFSARAIKAWHSSAGRKVIQRRTKLLGRRRCPVVIVKPTGKSELSDPVNPLREVIDAVRQGSST
jgi:hypothetical protein